MLKESIRSILTQPNPSENPPIVAEALKFMNEKEKDLCYRVFLESGNYDRKSTFMKLFSDDIFDAVTGKPIDLSGKEITSALRESNVEEDNWIVLTDSGNNDIEAYKVPAKSIEEAERKLKSVERKGIVGTIKESALKTLRRYFKGGDV